MSQAPAMPMFWGDYWSKTRRLTPTQHHAYLFLLGATWMNNCIPFPDDDDVIAGEIGLSVSAWRKVRPALMRFFNLTHGTWRNPKLEEVWAEVVLRIAESQKKGRLGAARRWSKNHDRNQKRQQNQSSENAQALPKHCLGNGIQNQSQREEDSEAIASGAIAPPDPVKEMWARGVKALGEGSRSVIGRAVKEQGQLATMEAILACEHECPVDPLAFFIGCLKDQKERGRDGRLSPAAGIYKGFADALEERERQRDCGPDIPAVVTLLADRRAGIAEAGAGDGLDGRPARVWS